MRRAQRKSEEIKKKRLGKESCGCSSFFQDREVTRYVLPTLATEVEPWIWLEPSLAVTDASSSLPLSPSPGLKADLGQNQSREDPCPECLPTISA